MKYPLLFLLLIALPLFIGACSASDASPTGEPVLDVISLQTTPSLAFWLDQAASCANVNPGIGVYTTILPVSNLDPLTADLTLRLGNPLDTDPFVTVLGAESLVIIAGPDTPITSLSLESLRAIFTGKAIFWRDVPESNALSDESITVLSYPQGNDLQSHFTDRYLDSGRLTDNANIFSTANSLQALLKENPAAITYALASQVPASARMIPITGMEEALTVIYTLAITRSEPEGAIRTLLLCLQSIEK